MEDFLTIGYGISRGINTQGWTIVTLKDQRGKRYSTCGGGYDMQGTVFAEYLEKNHFDKIKAMVKPYNRHSQWREGEYGFEYYEGAYWLDGGCGIDSMINIARLAGLEVKQIRSGKKFLGYMISQEEKQ